MSLMFPSLIIYVPVLHEDLIPAELPANIVTLNPGLPRPRSVARSLQGQEKGRLSWTPDFPYKTAEAAACLEDLKSLNEGGPLLAAAAMQGDARRAGMEADEERALARFAGAVPQSSGQSSGQTPEAVPGEDTLQARRRAQRLLLLVWAQEERIAETRRLLSRYEQGAAALAAAFGSDEDFAEDAAEAEETNAHAALRSSLRDFPQEKLEDSLPPWRFALARMAPFLPPEAALFTADERMIAAIETLNETGAPAEAGQAETDLAASGWSADFRANLRVERLSLRQLLGLSASAPEEDALDAPRFVFMYKKWNT